MKSNLWLAVICMAAPLPAAEESYVIQNAKIVTVSGPVIEQGSVLIRGAVIADVGAKVAAPAGVQKIDGRGLTVYPGLFNANSVLGLVEISTMKDSIDKSDLGEYMPQLLAFSAFHAESELLPVARVSGVTTALTRPLGGVLPGQGAILHLAGWTAEEMAIQPKAVMVLTFPSLLTFSAPVEDERFEKSPPYSAVKAVYDRKIRELKALLKQAREPGCCATRQLEALVPVVQGRQPVLLEAFSYVDIQNAVEFAKAEKLNYILAGATDAWKVTGFLKQNKVRVILGPPQSLPAREDDPIDITYTTPAILHQAGIPFAIATGTTTPTRVQNLRHEIGNAVAHGLPYDAALRSVTLAPAEFLGVGDKLGSIEKGKLATLVIADGDLFEYRTHIRHLFIAGKAVPIDSKQIRLYEKYKARP